MNIEEMIGSEAADRLREKFGCIVDYISFNPKMDLGLKLKVVELELVVRDRKTALSSSSSMEREIGIGVAEIRAALYRSLEIGKKGMNHMDEAHICVDNILPKGMVLMNSETYSRLMCFDREILREIGRILDRT